MRKAYLVILIIVAMIVAAAWWAVHSPGLMAWTARRLIGKAMPGATVSELSFKRQDFAWPGRFRWEDAVIAMDFRGRTYTAKASEVVLAGAESLLSANRSLRILLQGANVQSPPGKAKDISAEIAVEVRGSGPPVLDGEVRAASVQWDKVKASDVVFRIAGDTRQIELKDIKAAAYGGNVFGRVQVIFEGLVFKVDMSANNIQTARLRDLNKRFASEVIGRARGRLNLAGHGEDMTSLETEWEMLEGTTVGAVLLSALSPYIPASRESKRLGDLIKKGGQLPVEVLSCKLRSASPRQIGGEVKLKSREVNLELNVTPEINTDGTLTSLVSYWQKYSK